MLPIGRHRRLRGHGLPDLLDGDAARGQRVEVVADAHGALLSALDVDLRDAGQHGQRGLITLSANSFISCDCAVSEVSARKMTGASAGLTLR